jgi:kynureninase
MPCNQDTFILPTIELTFSAKMYNHNCNGQNHQLTPQDSLNNQAEKWQISITSEAFARKLDENDPLRHVRDEFYFPKSGGLPKGMFISDKLFNIKFYLYIYLADKSRVNSDDDCVYLCGHSLGLQPKRVRKSIDAWIKDWAEL